MRVIAGEFRGRTLLPPQGDATRPITDRAKQSLFDILTPLIPGAVVYDLFAGTGSMGLECLSRGAAKAVFFEADRSALARLRQNIDALGAADRAKVIGGDLFKWLRPPRNSADPPPAHLAAPSDLVFLDPPYRFLRQRAEDLRALAAAIAQAHLAAGATVVFRHDAADALDLPPLAAVDTRRYGTMAIDLLRRPD